MRKLKFHEKKLLKKVDFVRWKSSDDERQSAVMRRYRIDQREEYVRYNRIVGRVRKLSAMLTKLHPRDPFRMRTTKQLLEKLHRMGLINATTSLSQIDKLTVAAVCRRRLPVVLVRLHMAESIKQATTYIQQGHVRVGTEVVSDPAFLVTRDLEDYVTWVDGSKIQRHIRKYHDKLDDYDLLMP
ncbi:MAG: hypothetical protein MHM6MM_001351 [Cercozoa sp. M6MM]